MLILFFAISIVIYLLVIVMFLKDGFTLYRDALRGFSTLAVSRYKTYTSLTEVYLIGMIFSFIIPYAISTLMSNPFHVWYGLTTFMTHSSFLVITIFYLLDLILIAKGCSIVLKAT